MKLFYLYEIAIHNPDSQFNECFYYGKHEIDATKADLYFGSGIIIKHYIKKYGTDGLSKTILSYYSSSEELCQAEKQLVAQKKLELGDKCLNLAEGGEGSWAFVNATITTEQKHANALAGGLGNKKRLEDQNAHKLYVEKCVKRHANMSSEYKSNLYNKVSKSLKSYYKSDDWQSIKEAKLSANIATNRETSKRWRADFYNIFGTTPESFRKYGKLQEALNLYKAIKNLSTEEKRNEVNRFMEQIIS